MPHGVVREIIPAAAADVFDLIHDYSRRLEWDTLLQAAFLTDGWSKAGLNAVSVCQGRVWLGGIALKTAYVAFDPGRLAAIRMLNRPAFFEAFAASISHQDLADGTSSVTYTYTFSARPRWLRWLLHPLMNRLFAWETRRRLWSLQAYFSDRRTYFTTAIPVDADSSIDRAS